ncbi:alpha/beta hydrolase [Xenorhabdus budapestensis]|uniref:Alpha/beta hydrolase n=1 Tax=Xenorhabdus budapestensis TaxID=290110 RepID=A0A2D0J258_XENBU|nr:alpha/beta hydrolase [Xenorhabdus budapestensis]
MKIIANDVLIEIEDNGEDHDSEKRPLVLLIIMWRIRMV